MQATSTVGVIGVSGDGGTATIGQDYVFSIYGKEGSAPYLLVNPDATAFSGGSTFAGFDLSLGVVLEVGGSSLIKNTYIEKAANGFFRCSLVIEADTAGALTLRSNPYSVAGSLVSPSIGDNVHIWGAQLEEGAFPTSYIPTEAAQVTRAADNCVRVLGDEFNPNQFSVFFDYKLAEGVLDVLKLSSIRVFGFSDGTNNNRLSLAVTTLLVSDSGVRSTYSLTTNLTQRGKVALSYDGTTLKVCLNGGIILTQSSSKNAELDRMLVGSSEAVSAGAIIVKQEILFPTALSEAELITLTGGA
jgi:hypothetical protein